MERAYKLTEAAVKDILRKVIEDGDLGILTDLIDSIPGVEVVEETSEGMYKIEITRDEQEEDQGFEKYFGVLKQ